MLLRIRKRRTISEPGNRALFLQVEFSDENRNPDLQPSVYDVQVAEIVQTHTEHYAGNNLNPESRKDFDVSGLHNDIRVSHGRPPFAFTMAAHRELLFSSVADLEGFVNHLIREVSEREYEVTKSEMRDYVKSRVRDHDCEWLQYGQRARTTWKKWIDSARDTGQKAASD